MNISKVEELAKKIYGAKITKNPLGNPTYEFTGTELAMFAELIAKDCMAMCDELKEEYFKHRKGTMDFDEKHIHAEGESACFNLRFKMKKHFGVEE